jgi:PAS domain S-box-containing protein
MIIVSFIGISTIWVFDGGINGSDMMVALVILMLCLIGVSDKNKKYVLLLFLVLTSIIYLIQLYRPDLIIEIPSQKNRWIDSIITAIYSSLFIFLIVSFVHKNYTNERQRAEENERKFRSLSENSQDFIARYDRQHRHIYVNKSGIAETGLPANFLLGKTHTELGIYNDEQCEMWNEIIENVYTKKQPQFKQFSIDLKTGHIHQDVRLFPELNDKNEVVSVLSVSRDITILKQSEIDLLQLNADKDRFISILAHDLKNPFNTLLGFSKLLTDNVGKYNTEKIEFYASSINKVAQNTYNLLENLLMWTMSMSGKLNYEPQKMYVNEIYKDIFEILKPNAIAKNITIRNVTSNEIAIVADIYMLKTILRNIISNAIKFTPNGGQIKINTEEDDHFVYIGVSDNGVGMNQDVVNSLFDFSRSNTSKGTADEVGTGLGLLLCKEFVEKHGGEIWATSRKGKGSEFKFSLPK